MAHHSLQMMVLQLQKKLNWKMDLRTWEHSLSEKLLSKTNDVAGDGTTTATVLAQAMVNEGMKNLAAGANPIVLRKGMKKATDKAVEAIAEMSSKVTGKEQIARVAAVSSGDDVCRTDGSRCNGKSF